jgi:hypothetical protein
MQEDAERSVESILPVLNELGNTLGYNAKDNPDWWKTVDLSEHGISTEFIAGLLKNINETGELSTLDDLSVEDLKEKLSVFNSDIDWSSIIKAANEDATNAAKNMVKPADLHQEIDRVCKSLGYLSRGEDIPEWLWQTEEKNTSSTLDMKPGEDTSLTKPVIPNIGKAIQTGVTNMISGFMNVFKGTPTTPVDAGNGVIEQKVEIVANFPDATDRDEIKAAFDDLIGLAVQHANQNVKGK